MTNPKNDRVTALALELLEDAEMSRTSVESMVLKASRLARLIEDEEAETWLWHERYGYTDQAEISLQYMSRTNRWTDKGSKKGYFASLATMLIPLSQVAQYVV